MTIGQPQYSSAVRKSLIIACNPRSGSSLLCEALTATGVAGHVDEWLLPRRVMKWGLRHGIPTVSPRIIPALLRYQFSGRSSRSENFNLSIWARWMPRYFARLTEVEVTPNGVFGLQLHRGQYMRAVWVWGIALDEPNVPTTWVHLRRRDRLAQAVSWAKAIQDERWNTSMDPRDEAHYDGELISVLFRRAVRQDREWFEHFEALGITPLRLEYEEYRNDLRSAVESVLRELGEEIPQLEVPELRHQPQADASSQEWIERFTLEYPDLAAQRFAETD